MLVVLLFWLRSEEFRSWKIGEQFRTLLVKGLKIACPEQRSTFNDAVGDYLKIKRCLNPPRTTESWTCCILDCKSWSRLSWSCCPRWLSNSNRFKSLYNSKEVRTQRIPFHCKHEQTGSSAHPTDLHDVSLSQMQAMIEMVRGRFPLPQPKTHHFLAVSGCQFSQASASSDDISFRTPCALPRGGNGFSPTSSAFFGSCFGVAAFFRPWKKRHCLGANGWSSASCTSEPTARSKLQHHTRSMSLEHFLPLSPFAFKESVIM